MNLSPDPWVWIASLLSLAIFSFLYKENPVYRVAEHVFIGVANGYLVTFYWHSILVPILFKPLFQQGRLILIISFILKYRGLYASPSASRSVTIQAIIYLQSFRQA
jgi:hypothetical protein